MLQLELWQRDFAVCGAPLPLMQFAVFVVGRAKFKNYLDPFIALTYTACVLVYIYFPQRYNF